MAELTTTQRDNLRKSSFAVPSREAYPVTDKAHAASALQMSHGARSGEPASAEDHTAVHALVKKKFPEMWREHMANAHGGGSEGTHRMSDGAIMADSMMKKPTGHQMVEQGLAEYRKKAGAKK